MKNKLKYFYNNSKLGFYLLYLPKKVRDSIVLIKNNRLTDQEYIQKRYKECLQRNVNLKNPTLFTEKIQWLKLNDRNDLYTKCADKYLVRNYVEEKIGSQYLIPLVSMTEDFNDVNQDKLPDYPVIIKTTHDSGGTFIVNDKKTFDFKRLQGELSQRLKNNFYYLNREWEYKNIKPRIIVEKLLKDDSGNKQLNDYKIYCFHGKPMFIQTIFDRGVETKEDWYDRNWKLLDVYYFSPLKKHVEKPQVLEELLSVAEKLSQDFPYVRVDLYVVNNQIYFGELTFRPYGGFMKFVPESFDVELGQHLNIKNEKEGFIS
ncbi:ATP-grasp fold amidoligase family protein [Sulfurovum sp.]|jgi:hypothetical protein|uniref:ATP-grasp fold amidoligase family protein n=1 Tax=Sulfurovum sp. TaxID=1969726 RepID=UPI002A35982B|nr:ATP-grasp fold amidoligase family protein [Sulfurovum sp.]MDY0402706.1 ATP-grasp fold amidoligase family protein [Sulfurovum sp.]